MNDNNKFAQVIRKGSMERMKDLIDMMSYEMPLHQFEDIKARLLYHIDKLKKV